MPKRQLIALSLATAAALGSAGAWALGFGPVRAMALLGQPLDASVVLRLEAGETLTDECVDAKVTAGDVTLPDDQVSASFIHPPGFEARIRVRSWVPINEPFVTLQVSAGCETPLSRQFTVFVDPPPLAVALEGRATASPSPSPTPAPPATVERAAPRVAAGAAAAPPRSTGRRSTGTVKRAPRETEQQAVVVNRARADAVVAAPAVPVPAETQAERAQAQRSSAGAVSRGEGVAQLRLDSAIVTASADTELARATQQKEEAISAAKIAFDVAEVANTEAIKRISEMEAQLALARKEVAQTREAFEKLRAEQLARVQSPDVYTIALAAACGLLLLIAAALYMRLRRLDAERLQGWLKDQSRFSRYSEFDTVAPLTQQFPDFPRTVAPPTAPRQAAPQPQPVRAEAAPAAAAPAVASTQSFTETEPSSTVELDHAPQAHDISIEELLDVEQQAEFFVVLGQDDAAIDLLTSHVMASGGASPIPYLKLLEIFRRIGDQTSYERTRKRFNARFNGVAPEWGADPTAGRTLDEYPDAMRRIERAWPDPVDAMTELQTLMFRNDSNLLFELPAYRDIMLLFTVARDLHDAGADSSLPVDVLLPLAGLPEEAERDSRTLPGLGEASAAPPAGELRLVDDPPPGTAANVARR